MNNASILIVGATRGTGLEVARALRATGNQVTAVVRESSDTAALDALGVSTVVADIFSLESVAAVFSGQNYGAVVLSLSGKRGEARRPDRDGVRIIVAAAKASGVTRVLMVTAIGCGDSRAAVAPKVLEILGEVLAIKTEAEDELMQAGIEVTILRPGGLTYDPSSGTAIKTEDHSVMGVISRADLGDLVAECLADPATIGRIYHAIDPAITWQAPLQRGVDIPKS
jgi:uncharacterized protein YbjT (DUF2867 family)